MRSLQNTCWLHCRLEGVWRKTKTAEDQKHSMLSKSSVVFWSQTSFPWLPWCFWGSSPCRHSLRHWFYFLGKWGSGGGGRGGYLLTRTLETKATKSVTPSVQDPLNGLHEGDWWWWQCTIIGGSCHTYHFCLLSRQTLVCMLDTTKVSSRQKYFSLNKPFAGANIRCDKHNSVTKLLLQQAYFCCSNIMFVVTKVLSQQAHVCLDKRCFVASLLLQNFCCINNYTCGSSRQWQCTRSCWRQGQLSRWSVRLESQAQYWCSTNFKSGMVIKTGVGYNL